LKITKPKVGDTQFRLPTYSAYSDRDSLNIIWPARLLAMNYQARGIRIVDDGASDGVNEPIT